jgi:hypothetical protein
MTTQAPRHPCERVSGSPLFPLSWGDLPVVAIAVDVGDLAPSCAVGSLRDNLLAVGIQQLMAVVVRRLPSRVACRCCRSPRRALSKGTNGAAYAANGSAGYATHRRQSGSVRGLGLPAS